MTNYRFDGNLDTYAAWIAATPKSKLPADPMPAYVDTHRGRVTFEQAPGLPAWTVKITGNTRNGPVEGERIGSLRWRGRFFVANGINGRQTSKDDGAPLTEIVAGLVHSWWWVNLIADTRESLRVG